MCLTTSKYPIHSGKMPENAWEKSYFMVVVHSEQSLRYLSAFSRHIFLAKLVDIAVNFDQTSTIELRTFEKTPSQQLVLPHFGQPKGTECAPRVAT